MPLTEYGRVMLAEAVTAAIARTVDVSCDECGGLIHVDFRDTLRSGDALSFKVVHRNPDLHDVQVFVNGIDITR